MKYVHPADRLRPWFGAAVGLAPLLGMLAFGILGRNFGTLQHLKALNDAGSWVTMSLIEATAGILALLLAAVALGERNERGEEGPHFISLIRLTARGGFATIAPALLFDVLKVTTTSVAGEGLVITALVVVQIALLAVTIGAFAFMLSSLWATLRVTFVGVPESAPEETPAEESAEVRY
jgi:MFS family permease